MQNSGSIWGGSSQIADLWADCPACGSRYGAYFASCPQCGRENSFAIAAVNPERNSRGTAAKVAVAAIGIIGALMLVLAFLAPAIPALLGTEGAPPAISILPPFRQEPEAIPQSELVQHALDVINKDRTSFGLEPVALSTNLAAQVHAEDVFKNKQISHWMSNGEKPYMTYSRYGGTGGMGQNVAIAGFSKDQYDQCVQNTLYDCEKIDPLATIEELEYEMMYNDKDCCADGHRNNILNNYHTNVSIGIVYDKYYLALVQNFENNYGLDIDLQSNLVHISGKFAAAAAGTIDQVAIYYDENPSPELYEQNKRSLSYSGGKLVAVVAKPLPPGFFYDRPEGYRIMVADKWNTEGEGDADGSSTPIDISFNLARAVRADGVYTVSVIAKASGSDENFEAGSYSVVIDSTDQAE
ncbi:MAG TPA: CAP domain-containing protein [Nitrososphaera sp.]|nr:CAP domain-containing protein [Nitrososphaera sp.]